MKRLAALLGLICTVSVPHGFAARMVETVSVETGPSAALIARAELVRDVIARARTDRDVSMMLVAATMLTKSDFVLVRAENAPLVIGRLRAGDALRVIEPTALLREAAGWAKGDSTKLAAIEAAQAEAGKGIVPAAIVYTHDLPAERALTMRARAEGGRLALVRVRSDGDSPLELTVVDAQGRLACVDRPLSSTAQVVRRDLSCRWTPNRTDEFRITLRNRGRVWTRAILVSN